MIEMTAPSKEMATRLIAKLGYEGRLLGCEVSPWSGCNDLYLFSLEEAADFLDADLDVLSGMNGFMHLIEPDDLRAWIENQFGDSELVASIAELMSYKLKIASIRPIKELLLARLKQCREVLGKETKVKEVC
jgi:hypothetical protein